MKSIRIIPIALAKLKKRGVSEEVVHETIEQPEEVVGGYGGRRVAHRRVNIQGKAYLLRVVYEDDPEEIVVITAYLTSDIERYWRGGQ